MNFMLEYIGFVMVFLFLILVDFIGNIFVIIVIINNKNMKIVMNYVLVNLVIVDILVVIFMGIKFVIVFIFVYLEGKIGWFFCKFVIGGIIVWMVVVVLIYSLVVIVVEVYYVVYYFFKRCFGRVKNLYCIVIFIWVVVLFWGFLLYFLVIYVDMISICVE